MPDNSRSSIVDLYRPDSPIGTEFLRLYHNVVKRTKTEGAKSFLITSATVGEGKSTVASFLALTLASIKKKTLLIDADLRRPALHRLFNVQLHDGISEVVEGSKSLSQVLKPCGQQHLTLLTAGRMSTDPSDYFESGRFQRFFAEATSMFDFAIVDCAPIVPVADPLVLSQLVSGVLLVVKAGETHRELVARAIEILERAEAPILGVLLNNVKQVLPTPYTSRYAYDYYRPTTDTSD